MNKILMSSGYPPIIIFAKNKQSYFNSFTKDINNKKYYHFMLKQSVKSYDYLFSVIKKY